MAELAIVGSQKAKLKALAAEGDRGAARAEELAKAPGGFLATVQAGITLFSVVSGVLGGAVLGYDLNRLLSGIPALNGWSYPLSMVLVSAVITYFAVVLGELAPKRLALSNPEKVAAALAPMIDRLSRWTSPFVGAINGSSDLLLRLFGVKRRHSSAVSEDEVRVMIDEGLSTGVFRPEEKEMVEGVFELDELTTEDLMTPRAQLVCLSMNGNPEENWTDIARSGHSHFPVYEGSRDNVVGMVSVKALWANLAIVGHADLRSVIAPPFYVPVTMSGSALLEEFKKNGRHNALVVDEFGGLQGMVTLKDVMMAIVGDLPERGQRDSPQAMQRPDGSWLVDALLDIDDLKKNLSIDSELPGEDEDEFTSTGGFLLFNLGHIPTEGEVFAWRAFRFEVIDMDRQRIDKVLVTMVDEPALEAEPDPDK